MRGEYSWIAFWAGLPWELPPRARRIPRQAPPTVTLSGTTSACAENTALNREPSGEAWNYLCVRGEYSFAVVVFSLVGELPPRARRIRGGEGREGVHRGTTSACAENTWPGLPSRLPKRNYLRVRGEYSTRHRWGFARVELPPRARRIHLYFDQTCVRKRNYLRVRGEYANEAQNCAASPELPPRARRIPSLSDLTIRSSGTTSACAENTELCNNFQPLSVNYLRVRGEYRRRQRVFSNNKELPPRARRIRCATPPRQQESGTTSACAENTHSPPNIVGQKWNYLRVRGEYRPR